jgi:hypothetical protein
MSRGNLLDEVRILDKQYSLLIFGELLLGNKLVVIYIIDK